MNIYRVTGFFPLQVCCSSIAVRPACRSRWDAAMSPRLGSPLYTTRMTAWMPSLGLRELLLAALHHSQNQ